MPNQLKLFVIIVVFPLLLSCSNNTTAPELPINYTYEIKGQVVLENQSEHSNALVYLDILDRGVSTDSTGSYAFTFSEADSIYYGEFKIYYYLHEYELDSSKYFLEYGKVMLDSLDVDSEGNFPEKELKQFFSIEGWTDRSEYNIGDSVCFNARFTNLTNSTLYLFNGGDTSPLGWVILYNQVDPPIGLNIHDPYGSDLQIFLEAGGFYEESGKYLLPSTAYYDNPPLTPGKYLIISGIKLYNYYQGMSEEMYEFMFYKWDKIHRGEVPQYDLIPNKYKYPLIQVYE